MQSEGDDILPRAGEHPDRAARARASRDLLGIHVFSERRPGAAPAPKWL